MRSEPVDKSRGEFCSEALEERVWDASDPYDEDFDSGSDVVEYDEHEEQLRLQWEPRKEAYLSHQVAMGTYLKNPHSASSSLLSVVKKKKRRRQSRRRRRLNKMKRIYDDDDDDGSSSNFSHMDEQRMYWRWHHSQVFKVTVDGFFRKHVKGGYGAVIRDKNARVIAAAAGVSVHGPVSVLYHQLEGVKRGLELAMEYRCRQVRVVTCSEYTIRVLNKECFPDALDYFKVMPLLEEIQEMRRVYFTRFRGDRVDRILTRAADYMAKLEKTVQIKPHDVPEELRGIICDYMANPEKTVQIKPPEFPEELRGILCEDANHAYYNIDAHDYSIVDVVSENDWKKITE